MKKYVYFIIVLCFILVGCHQKSIHHETAKKIALQVMDGNVVKEYEYFTDTKACYLFIIVKENNYYEVMIHRDTGNVIYVQLMDDNEGIKKVLQYIAL